MSAPRFSIRHATRKDGPALVRLIIALADFEKLAGPDADAQQRLIEDGFGARPKFETLLAFWNGENDPVGYAIFLETYATFLARPGFSLEDLFVLHSYRGRGVGSALLRHCIRLAHERGCGRMEWTCLDWNTKAQCMYERMGARRLSNWQIFRLERERIEQLAAENVA